MTGRAGLLGEGGTAMEGTALVYLRQSTMVQVREHTESTMRPYTLADTAVRLDWAPGDVEVIDADMGLSGTSAAHRQGFRELMSQVCPAAATWPATSAMRAATGRRPPAAAA